MRAPDRTRPPERLQIIGHEPPLYLAGSYATEKEFFETELDETPQSVYRNLRVAKLATPDEVALYSPTRLNLGVVYYEAKTKTTVSKRGELDFKKLRIAIKRDGKAIEAALDKVSYAELNAAIALLGDPAKKTPKSEVTKVVEAAVKRTGVKDVKVTTTKTQFSVRGPLSGINAVWRGIAGVDVPTG